MALARNVSKKYEKIQETKRHNMATLRSLLIIISLTFVFACGHTMKYSKSVPPIIDKISAVKVMDVEGCCRKDFIKNILIVELSQIKKIKIDDNAKYALHVKVDGYHPRYRRYIALTAKITDIETNKTEWVASISGVAGRIFIDEVIKNTINELVREMTQSM
jgi:hypothetical protein